MTAPPAAPDSPTLRIGGGPDSPAYAWSPAEPAPKRRRTGLWIGLAAGAAVVAFVAASLILIAPGTSVAGVAVGGMTAGGAADAIQQRLAETTLVVDTDAGQATLTGAQLGATVDASGLADAAFAEHPMWNPTQWFPDGASAVVALDSAAADAALSEAFPELFEAPVDATLAYDSESVRYVTTAAEDGTGIDLAPLRAALQDAFDSGAASAAATGTVAAVAPLVSTETVEATAGQLNGILEGAGFYIHGQRTVAVDPAVAASWLSVSQTPEGTFEITADQAAIQTVVDTLPGQVNREAITASVITDTEGGVLRTDVEGADGLALGSTDGIAADYAAQLAGGNAAFELPVAVTAHETIAAARSIEVNLSTQQAILYENGQVFRTYAISSGRPGTVTPTGSFRVFAHVAMQDMGCFEGAAYCTENVPWVTYFSPDIGFHGAYWHNNFGTPMSHGCVNMPVDVAKFVYDWTPNGTEVWVHY